MNFREGMRRLGILLGAAGGIMGGFLAFVPAFGNAPGVWNTLTAHRKFEAAMMLPTVQKTVKDAQNAPAKGFVPPPVSSDHGPIRLPPGAKLVPDLSQYGTVSARPPNDWVPVPNPSDAPKTARRNPLDSLPPPRGGTFGGIPVDSTAAGAGSVDYDALDALAREHGGKPLTASVDDIEAYESQDGGITILPANPLLKGNRDGINSIQFDSAKQAVAIGFTSGEWVYRTEAPKFSAYLVLLAFPAFGFLLPWGVVRLVTWVGTGFFTPKSG
jgi:hypothetical protein